MSLMEQIESLLKWSEPVLRSTVNGDRLYREALIPDGSPFWTVWRSSYKQALIDAGIRVWPTDEMMPNFGGRTFRSVKTWHASWWTDPMTNEEVEAINKALEESVKTETTFNPVKPTGLTDDYFMYQKVGVEFGLKRTNVLIADEMRLGKTMQAIGIINTLGTDILTQEMIDTDVKRVLVMCPSTPKLNWERELKKWLAYQRAGILVLFGKPNTEKVDCLNRFLSFDPQVWKDDFQNGVDVTISRNNPSILSFLSTEPGRIGAEFPDNQSASKSAEPVNQRSIGIINNNAPTASIHTNRTFSVNDSSHVGSVSVGVDFNAGRHCSSDKLNPSSSFDKSRKTGRVNTKLSGNTTNSGTIVNESDSVSQLTLGDFSKSRHKDLAVVVLNYDILSGWADHFPKNWDIIIADEAHYMKNPKTQRAKVGLNLKAKRIIALTGTPFDKLKDLYHVLHWIDPVTWQSEDDFKSRYVFPTQFGSKEKADKVLDNLQRRLRSTCMVRRLKKDVWKDLPDKQHQSVVIAAEDKKTRALLERQIELFDRVYTGKNERLAQALEETGEGADLEKVLASIGADKTKNYSADFQELARIYHQVGLMKLPYVIEHVRAIIDENPKYKLVIFAFHKDIITILERAINERLNESEIRQMVSVAQSREHQGESGEVDVPLPVRAEEAGIESNFVRRKINRMHKLSTEEARTFIHQTISAVDEFSYEGEKTKGSIHNQSPGHYNTDTLSTAWNQTESENKRTLRSDKSIDRSDQPGTWLHKKQHLDSQLEGERNKAQRKPSRTTNADSEFIRKAVVLDGKTSSKKRQEVIDRFKNDDSIQLFIGQHQAAAEGISLAAADHIIYAELSWRPLIMEQTSGRCDHFDKRSVVFIQYMVFKDSLDFRMSEVLVEKSKHIRKTLNSNEESIERLKLKKKEELKVVEVNVSDLVEEQRTGRRKEMEAAGFSKEVVEAIQFCLRTLSDICDGALEQDEMGFNGGDSEFGKSLASQSSLTVKQVDSAKRMLRKYKRQLPGGLYSIIYYNGKTEREYFAERNTATKELVDGLRKI